MQWWNDLRAAFKSWVSILSSLVAAVSLFSLVMSWLSLPLATLVVVVVKALHDTFHPLIEFLFGWIPIRWTPEMRDGVIVWLAFGGAVLRTCFELALRRMRGGIFKEDYVARLTWTTTLEFFAARRALWPLVMPLIVVAWPVFVVVFFLTPFLVEETPGRFVVERVGRYTREELYKLKLLICDFRMVFVFQVVAISLAIIVLAIANSILIHAPFSGPS